MCNKPESRKGFEQRSRYTRETIFNQRDNQMKSIRAIVGVMLASQFFTVCQGQGRPQQGEILAAVKVQDRTPAAPADKPAKEKKKAKRLPASASAATFCPKDMALFSFQIDATGNVSDTGRSVEGPACIQVYFPAAQFRVSLAQATTTSAGPKIDLTTLGNAPTSGGGSETLVAEPPANNVENRFAKLAATQVALHVLLTQTKNRYAAALDDQTKVIAEIKNMLQSEIGVDATRMPDAVKNGYRDLQSALKAALGDEGTVTPTDRADTQGRAILPALQQLLQDLTRLKIDFAGGESPAANQAPRCTPDDIIRTPSTRNLSFSAWSGACQSTYDAVVQLVNADIQEAQNYTSTSEKTTQLRSKLAIVKYWNSLFENLGLRKEMTASQIGDAKIDDAFATAVPVRCGTLFNLNSSTAVNVVSIDESPTLDGGSPAVKTQSAFVNVTCGSPFAVSAGIAFSTIQQKEFAIIKSSGGPGNPSVNTFGSLNDSRLHPMPIGVVHVRLGELGNSHRYAFHASFGVAGNIRDQSSGGSAAEFLPGMSVSFFRTMFLSFGPHIGTKAALAGGFKEGDLAPSDITSIQGQVKHSYTVGFGFAITFTKP